MKEHSRIIITTTEDGQLDIALAGIPDFPTFAQHLFTGLLAMMDQTKDRAARTLDPAQFEEAVGEIYDMVNNAASNTLSMFAPEIDMRPTVTTEALRRMEDQVMAEQVAAAEAQLGEPITALPFKPRTM